MLDYIRLACAVPAVQVGNVPKNTEDICSYIAKADGQNVDLLVFPELALTGYSCADLFFQKSLQDAALTGVKKILSCSAQHPALTLVVGLPWMIDGSLYNCAAVISGGVLRGIVPKTYLPNYGEFGEKRWFAACPELCQYPICADKLGLDENYEVPLGNSQFFCLGDGVKLGVELCEDLWSPLPPSASLALGGAEVIVNLAASHEVTGKRTLRRDMVKHQSAACLCAYAFCSAGYTESTQDVVFSGHSMIAQGGALLAENEKLLDGDYMLVTDVDIAMLRAERAKNTTFRDTATLHNKRNEIEAWECASTSLRGDGSLFPLAKLPFVAQTASQRITDCRETFAIQAAGLARRLSAINAKAVIGISGGLDSTLALLVAVEAMRLLGRPATDVHGITMPCFGTSDRTYNNAWELMRKLGISTDEISIRDAVTTHFKDIGHDPANHDTTYENAQARERTQILMDYAGKVGGIVVGTGDLSELALGWCTYNGDHMSMYSVNGSIPKSLIRWIVEAVAQAETFAPAKSVLEDILDTPISPELLPPDATGKISQQTEDIVGPYALHDFFLYHMVRYGFTPGRIYTMACRAFREDFDGATVKKWLVTFYRRFFTQQFKRSCQPDGVKAGPISFSPRGDWQMPSDAVGKLWIAEAENL